MGKHLMSGTHGSSSADKKMGKHQNTDRGSWVERYQRRMGLWRTAGTASKQVVKDRANKKRRANDKNVVRNDADNG